jgi:hypothetical protein
LLMYLRKVCFSNYKQKTLGEYFDKQPWTS